MHTMTCLVLTAAAALWSVIGLTVIGTVFLPLWALEMGHNAAVDLTAAVRWKPCNCNFPRLPFFFLPFERWHDHLWVEGISWPSGPWNLVNRQHAISKIHGCQWENEPSIRHSAGTCFFFVLFCFGFFLQIHVFTRQQRFAAGPPPWGKVRFEVSTLQGEDHTSTNTGIVAGR